MKREKEHLLFSEELKIEIERKKPGIVVHRDVLKKERKEKRETDTIDKREIYLLVLTFKTMYRRRKKFLIKLLSEKRIKRRNYYHDEIKICDKMIKESKDLISLHYVEAGKLLTRHRHFKDYKFDMKYDMVMDALTRGLSIGKEGKNNFGLPYFARFKFCKGSNVFSYWQQQQKNFFYQFIGKKYAYNNDLQYELSRIMSQFAYDAIYLYGEKHVRFHLGQVTEKDSD